MVITRKCGTIRGMIWLVCIILLAFMTHFAMPSWRICLALKAINMLYQLKMWLIRRERRRLQSVLVQIAQEKAALRAEEQECHKALHRLTDEEQAVQKRLRPFLPEM